ncbi:MAG: M48 family metalloprotease [Alphaproteobacteria bacterium]|nr:M48 family metalloprotease [Alphaproteobacteria bacterium]MBV9900964.1 M48 family metalloprotease [Alphaproteobacteria bacterium]
MRFDFIRPIFASATAAARASRPQCLPALLCFALLAAAAPAPPAGTLAPGAFAAESGVTLRQDDLRVGAVAYRLALAGRGLCPQPFPLTGLLFHHLAEYLPRDRALMVSRYGLDRGPGVLGVVAGSPADQAGLTAGDVLLLVNGAAFPSEARIAAEPDRKRWRRMVEDSEATLEAALAGGPAELLVLRQGRELRLTLSPVRGCLGRVRLARSTQVNAFETGRYVVMTTAMLGFLHDDDELAVVLGHEMAHGILGHPPMRTEEGVLASLGIGAATLWDREAAADRLGLRLMAAAGYDLGAAIPFWRRYLTKYDNFPQLFRSHPSLAAREKIVREEMAAHPAVPPGVRR